MKNNKKNTVKKRNRLKKIIKIIRYSEKKK